MINLLPTTHADSIRYGRQNARLRNWLLGVAAAAGGLIVIMAGGWLYLGQQQRSYQKGIDLTKQQLKDENLSGVQADAKEISGDIKVITKLLSSEVRFSDLIQAIGNDMPPGAVLSNLSLTDQVSGAVSLSASTIDHNAAAQIAVNLGQSQSDLFSKIDILNITCTHATANLAYPCSATYKALFSKSAKTKFLSVAKE